MTWIVLTEHSSGKEVLVNMGRVRYAKVPHPDHNGRDFTRLYFGEDSENDHFINVQEGLDDIQRKLVPRRTNA